MAKRRLRGDGRREHRLQRHRKQDRCRTQQQRCSGKFRCGERHPPKRPPRVSINHHRGKHSGQPGNRHTDSERILQRRRGQFPPKRNVHKTAHGRQPERPGVNQGEHREQAKHDDLPAQPRSFQPDKRAPRLKRSSEVHCARAKRKEAEQQSDKRMKWR